MGKGWENQAFYMNTVLTFHSIANLEQVRKSFHTLQQKKILKTENQKGFWKALGQSEWYDFVSDIIEFSKEISE